MSSASKKVIFLLQRILNETSDDDRVLSLRAADEAKKKLAEAHAMLRSIANEFVGPSFWRYAHNISSGLQEYIEALSFVHYVECGGLVSYERAQTNLCDDTGQPVGRMYTMSSFAPALMRNRLGLSAAFSIAVVRLCPWSMRSYRGIDAPCYIFDFQAQRPHESLADFPLCQRLQGW